MLLEECWNISKNDLLVLTYYSSSTNFKIKIGQYFKTKFFNMYIRNYLIGCGNWDEELLITYNILMFTIFISTYITSEYFWPTLQFLQSNSINIWGSNLNYSSIWYSLSNSILRFFYHLKKEETIFCYWLLDFIVFFSYLLSILLMYSNSHYRKILC